MSRSVPLWVGRTHDSPVPPRVRLRIFERDRGICWISGRKIRPGEPWELDHKVALCNGGTHSEDNLAPALVDKHREKTKEDVAEKSRVYRKAAKNIGIRKASRLKGQSFRKAPKQRTASRPLNKRITAVCEEIARPSPVDAEIGVV